MTYRPKDVLVLALARWSGISVKAAVVIVYGPGRWWMTLSRKSVGKSDNLPR